MGYLISTSFYRRGPNKYTRNWEDEDAYGKMSGQFSTGKPNTRRSVPNRSGEEFPALNSNNKVSFENYQILLIALLKVLFFTG